MNGHPQVWFPRWVHGGDQHGSRRESSAHQIGISAFVLTRTWTSPHGPGGQPTSAWRALPQHIHQGALIFPSLTHLKSVLDLA